MSLIYHVNCRMSRMLAGAAPVTDHLSFALLTARLMVIVWCPRPGAPLNSLAFTDIG
jgi:hypothetical protein